MLENAAVRVVPEPELEHPLPEADEDDEASQDGKEAPEGTSSDPAREKTCLCAEWC